MLENARNHQGPTHLNYTGPWSRTKQGRDEPARQDQMRVLQAAADGTLPREIAPGHSDYETVIWLIERGYLTADVR